MKKTSMPKTNETKQYYAQAQQSMIREVSRPGVCLFLSD